MKEQISEEKRVENKKFMNVYMGGVSGVLAAYLFGYVGSMLNHYPNLTSAILATLDEFSTFRFTYGLSMKAINGILLGLGTGVIVYFSSQLHEERYGSYKMDEVAGSARFMTKKEMNEYLKEVIEPDPTDLSLPFPSMIMSQNFRRPMNSRKLIGNNNVMIVGGAGSGKSRFFIKPNVLQMNASYVITDPSGEMIYALGTTLKDNGYKIKIFNISDMEHSNCYNPLNYIRDEAGVNMLIDCFIKNTTSEGSKGDQFFTNAERLLYSACIFYLINHCEDETRRNFGSIISMINASAVDENNPNAKSPLDVLFDSLPKDSLAWKSYKAFKQAAGKTLKSIIISCVTRLQPFLTPQVANLTKTDTLNLERMGDEKTALFIITPQADRTYAFLASMLYSQLFETLYYRCEEQKKVTGSEQLKIPVRCMMDEFANIGEVPEFPSKLATMRKYNISATVVLQDISQIESMYKDDWKTLVGNCSSIVFLGTQEPNTLKYFSDMLGKGTVKSRNRGLSKGKSDSSSQNFQSTARELRFADELGRMSPKKCIVFTQNLRPVEDEKYKYENHPRYKFTADANDDLGFKFSEMPVYDNTRFDSSHILKAKSEVSRILNKNIVTDPQSLSKTSLKCENGGQDLDQMQFSPEIEKEAFVIHMANIQKQIRSELSESIPHAVVSNVSPKRLMKLASQTKVEFDRFVIFDVFSDEQKAYCVAYEKSKDLNTFFDVMNASYASEKKIGPFIVAKLSKNRIDEYLNKMKKELKGVSSDSAIREKSQVASSSCQKIAASGYFTSSTSDEVKVHDGEEEIQVY